MIPLRKKKRHIIPKTSKDGTEEFLNKIKENIHDPLPDPRKKSIFTVQGMVLLIVTLGLIVVAVFAVYYVFVQDNRTSSNNNTPAASNPGDSQTPTPIPSDGSLVSVQFTNSKNVFGMGTPIEIQYTVNGKARDEIDDFSSRLVEIYLTDHNGQVVGFIKEFSPSFGVKTFEWDPQIVSRNNTIHAPAPGQYRIEVALRNPRTEESLSGVEHKAQTSAFRLEYDTLSVTEFPFSSCNDIGAYNSERWYRNFTSALNQLDISLSSINIACYSEQGNVVVIVAPATDMRNYPLIARFNISANHLQKAVYKDARDTSPTESAKVTLIEQDAENKSASVGRRSGSIIPILIGGTNVFSYNYIENSFSDNL